METSEQTVAGDIPAVPPERDAVIGDVVAMLRGEVPGVRAIGLGGSRSIGTADPKSDYDIIVFLQQDGDIDTAVLRGAIERLSEGPSKVTNRLAFAEFEVRGHKVELLFRKLKAIEAEVEASKQGRFRRVLHPLHPAGYLTTVMISYVTYALPVWDPDGHLARICAAAEPYPEALRAAMFATFKNEAALSLIHAAKVRRPGELAYLSALYARAAACWSLYLFAANRRYPVIDKGAMRLIMSFPLHPEHFHGRTVKLFRDIAAGQLQQARQDAWALHRDVVATVEPKA